MTTAETEPATEPVEPDAAPDEDETAPDEEAEPETPPAEPEAEALIPAAQDEKEIKKRREQLDAEADRHAKRVTQILGEDSLGLIQCEACPTNTPGWHYPAADFPPDSPERSLYSMLAGGSGAEHKHPDYFITCSECNGYGNVRTGAQMGLITYEIACPICKTMGYIDRREEATVTLVETAPANGTVAPVQEDPAVLEDMWGRPFGHPRHGKFPIYLTAAERADDIAAGFKVG